MGRRKKQYGICKLCGKEGRLSFEHVPPKSAFNNLKDYYEATMDELVKLDCVDLDDNLEVPTKARKKKQGGIGFYTLCEPCNNKTGSWYASDFVRFSIQSMNVLLKSNGKPTLYYPMFFFPLRVIKQVITMFFSICHDSMRKSEPELQRFILNREARYLSPRYKIYCYYNLQGNFRYLGDIFSASPETGLKLQHISELSFPPLGFVLTIDSQKPDKRLVDISHFASFRYDDWKDMYLRLPVLPTYVPVAAGDYRSEEEIRKAIMSSYNNF